MVPHLQGLAAGGRQQRADGRRHAAAPDERHPGRQQRLGKTGTLTGVTALSGYVQGRDGRLYIFSMLSHYSGSTPRPVEDKLVVALAGWRR